MIPDSTVVNPYCGGVNVKITLSYLEPYLEQNLGNQEIVQLKISVWMR